MSDLQDPSREPQPDGKAYDARLLGRLWEFVRPYRLVFWTALFLSPVNQAFSLVQPYLLKLGIDGYVLKHDLDGLSRLGVFFIAAIIGEFVSYYWQQYLTMVVAQQSLADLRIATFSRLQRFPTASAEAKADMELAKAELLGEGPMRDGVIIPGINDGPTEPATAKKAKGKKKG